MKTLNLILLFILCTNLIGQNKISYKIYYSEQLKNEGIKVQVETDNVNNADSTCFYFANEVWGEKNIFNCIEINEKANPNYNFNLLPKKNMIVVHHPKSDIVKLTYHIKQDFEGERVDIFSRPKISNHHFQLLGKSLFIIPISNFDSNEVNPVLEVELNWVNFPTDFTLHNSFGNEKRTQHFSVRLWDELYNSIFVGGDFRIQSFFCKDKPVYLASRGNWMRQYNDSLFLESLEKVVSSQREFWQDYEYDYFSVIIAPTVTFNDSSFTGQSIKGSLMHNGFYLQTSNNDYNSIEKIKYMFNHELMHNWIGGKIHNKNEELNYWFSEGFTDYYTFKNRLISGDINQEEWLDLFNTQILHSYYQNPEKKAPNYLIKDKYWENRNIQKLPYNRGAIFAFWLDNQIILKSNQSLSLDDLMCNLLKYCNETSKPFTDELFLNFVKKYIYEDLDYFFQKHIICGELIDFENENLIDNFSVNYIDGIPILKIDGNLKF